MGGSTAQSRPSLGFGRFLDEAVGSELGAVFRGMICGRVFRGLVFLKIWKTRREPWRRKPNERRQWRLLLKAIRHQLARHFLPSLLICIISLLRISQPTNPLRRRSSHSYIEPNTRLCCWMVNWALVKLAEAEFPAAIVLNGEGYTKEIEIMAQGLEVWW